MPSPSLTSIPTGLTSSKTGTLYFAFGSNLSPTQMRGRLTSSPSSSAPIAIARLDNYKWIICQSGYANIVEMPTPANPFPKSTPAPALASEPGPASVSSSKSPSASVSISEPNSESSTSADAIVWGVLYNLSPADETTLDNYEGYNHYRNPRPTPNPIPSDRLRKPYEQGGWEYNKLYLPVTVTKWLVEPSTFGLATVEAGEMHGNRNAGEEPNSTIVTALVYGDELRTAAGKISPEYIGRMNRAIDESVKLGLPEEWCERAMRTWVMKGVYPRDKHWGKSEGYVEGE